MRGGLCSGGIRSELMKEGDPIMKIKIFQSMFERKVERQVNEFIEKSGIKVLEIQYRPTSLNFTACVIYEGSNGVG
jgi:hypothetical protein